MYQGFYRILLALLVVYAHLFPNVGKIGMYAVAGFFILSGFLVTRIVNGRYNDGWRGFRLFLLNRTLRIYPTYLVCLAITCCSIAAFPGVAAVTGDGMLLTADPVSITKQILIFGLLSPFHGLSSVTWIPVAWSLSVELVYYLLIAIVLGRSKIASILWLLAAAAYSVYAMFNLPIYEAYYSYFGTSIAFAAGSAMHHFGDKVDAVLTRFVSRRSPITAMGAMAAFLVYTLWQEPFGIYLWLKTHSMDAIYRELPIESVPLLYGTIPLAFLAMWAALGVKQDDASVLTSKKVASISAYLGELSYPVFLLHLPMLVLATGMLGGAGGMRENRLPQYSVAGVILTLLLAAAVVRYIDGPIQRIRARVRERATEGSSQPPLDERALAP